MNLITDKYRVLNMRLHQNRPGYGAGGARWANMITELASQLQTAEVLDYGCGKGMLKKELGWPSIRNYDPATFPGDPHPCDIVVCTDVLEHIEPECLDDVLSHIHALTKKIAFFNISTRKAHKTLADGRNAHLIVRQAPWWSNKLSEWFELETLNALPGEFNVFASPKKSGDH